MSSDRSNILIVDDIELNRAILDALFHDQYNVLEAENGQVALDLIEKYCSSIAVFQLDIVMPVLDGFDVLREMISTKAIETTPVIMITAESDEEKALKGYSMGVVDIINKPFNPDIVKRRVQNTVDLYMHKFYLEDMVERQTEALEIQNEKLKMSNNFIIDALSTAVEFRNQESGQNIRRIRALTKILLETLADTSEKYRLPPEEIEAISSASAMHDIGKIAIADAVLLKPGPLTKEEFDEMKTHTTKGCAILQSINFTGDLTYYDYCYEICRGHHERWDGRGYPDGLKGDEIPLWAQVVSLADVYDALTSDRVYKPAFEHAVAVKMIMNGECGVFNPELLASFEKIAQEFLDENKIREKSNPVALQVESGDRDGRLADADILPSSARARLELEKAKFLQMAELSDDIVFDYDPLTDIAWFSHHAADVFGADSEVSGFRHFLLSSDIIPLEFRGKLLNEAMKLDAARPGVKLTGDLKTKSGAWAAFDVYINALFESEGGRETGEKVVSYVGKLVRIR